ncbi:MAG: hypothetical protein LBC61_06100 [Candidatus Peribacteria bacterium]|nr:hypothetical protein [Candidatus Peribacteria bacterium]
MTSSPSSSFISLFIHSTIFSQWSKPHQGKSQIQVFSLQSKNLPSSL